MSLLKTLLQSPTNTIATKAIDKFLFLASSSSFFPLAKSFRSLTSVNKSLSVIFPMIGGGNLFSVRNEIPSTKAKSSSLTPVEFAFECDRDTLLSLAKLGLLRSKYTKEMFSNKIFIHI